jgi:hypothetical protein
MCDGVGLGEDVAVIVGEDAAVVSVAGGEGDPAEGVSDGIGAGLLAGTGVDAGF